MWFDSELLVSSRASVIEPDREERKEKLYDDDVTRFDGDRSERWEMKKFHRPHTSQRRSQIVWKGDSRYLQVCDGGSVVRKCVLVDTGFLGLVRFSIDEE